MGSYYSPYVNHCIRFYAKYPTASRFKSEADKLNWKAVSSSLKGLPDNDIVAILSVYSANGRIEGNVAKLSKDTGVKRETLWKNVCDFERKVAKNRGLI